MDFILSSLLAYRKTSQKNLICSSALAFSGGLLTRSAQPEGQRPVKRVEAVAHVNHFMCSTQPIFSWENLEDYATRVSRPLAILVKDKMVEKN